MLQYLKQKFAKYHNMPDTIKASTWFGVCNILQKGLSIIAVPIFTRLLTTQEYGIFSLFSSWFWLLIIFTSLNMYENSLNNAMMKFPDDREGYVSSVLTLSCIITVGLYIIYVPFSRKLTPFIGMNFKLVTALFIQLLVMPALYFWTAREKFDFKYRSVVIVTIVMSIFAISVSVFCVLLFNTHNRICARIYSMVIVQLLFCIAIAVRIYAKGKKIICKKYWKFALSFNLPIIPYYLSVTILGQADRLMINNLINVTCAGLYSLAYSIGTLTTLITSAINSSLNPWVYKCISKNEIEKVKSYMTNILMGVAIMICVFILFAPEIIKLFASKEYYEAVNVIPSIAASVFFIFVSQMIINIEFYFEKKKIVMIASFVSAIMNIILNFIFIPIYGYIAAGYTTLVCYIILALSHYIFYKKMKSKELDNRDLFNNKVLLIMSFFMIIAGTVMQELYSYMILRYLILGMILVISINQKSKIQSIITQTQTK